MRGRTRNHPVNKARSVFAALLLTSAFAVSYSKAAEAQGVWHHTVHGYVPGFANASAALIDGNKNLIVSGVHDDGGSIDTQVYDPTGKLLWSRTVFTGDSASGTLAALDGAGGIVVVTELASAFQYFKYSPTGTLLANSTQSLTDYSAEAVGLVVAGDGTSYALTSGRNYVSTNAGVIYKLDPAGSAIWSKPYLLHNSAPGFIASGALDSQGDLVVVGADLNVSSLAVAKYDPAGNQLFATELPKTEYSSEAGAVILDSDDDIYVGGDATTLSDAPLGLLTAKFDADGNEIWAHHNEAAGRFD